MKTSKIILISYSAFITLLLAGFLVVGLIYDDKAVTSKIENKNIEFQKVDIDLESFSHLHLSPGCRLTIHGGDNAKLYYHENGKIEKISPQYEIRNDTLFITSTKCNKGNWIELVVADLNSVQAQKANIRFNNLVQETLVIDAKKTGVVMTNKTNITNLQLQLAEQSKFNGSQYQGNSITLGISNSQVSIYSNKKLNSICGTADNNSNIHLPKSLKISLESDESSKVVIQ